MTQGDPAFFVPQSVRSVLPRAARIHAQSEDQKPPSRPRMWCGTNPDMSEA
jgi:hypothetical protein